MENSANWLLSADPTTKLCKVPLQHSRIVNLFIFNNNNNNNNKTVSLLLGTHYSLGKTPITTKLLLIIGQKGGTYFSIPLILLHFYFINMLAFKAVLLSY